MWTDQGGSRACANITKQGWRGCCPSPGVTRLRIPPEVKVEGKVRGLRAAAVWPGLGPTPGVTGRINRTGPERVSAQQLAHDYVVAVINPSTRNCPQVLTSGPTWVSGTLPH